jgi:hypothetical protein
MLKESRKVAFRGPISRNGNREENGCNMRLSSKMVVLTYQIIRCHNQQDHNVDQHIVVGKISEHPSSNRACLKFHAWWRPENRRLSEHSRRQETCSKYLQMLK